MKNKLISLALLLCLFLTGCNNIDGWDDPDDLIIWDFMCHSVVMKLTDASGNNLLDADFPGNILEDKIYVMYDDERYDFMLEDPEYHPQTRFLPPSYRELFLMKGKDNELFLCFGEFTPTANYAQEPFTIYWGDGTHDSITFDLYITWKSQREPTVHMGVSLNGKQISNNSLYLPLVK